MGDSANSSPLGRAKSNFGTGTASEGEIFTPWASGTGQCCDHSGYAGCLEPSCLLCAGCAPAKIVKAVSYTTPQY